MWKKYVISASGQSSVEKTTAHEVTLSVTAIKQNHNWELLVETPNLVIGHWKQFDHYIWIAWRE